MTDRLLSTPIKLDGGSAACLLLHGFTGSTYELEGLSRYLHNQGYHVHAPLLAGHGTSLEELSLVQAEDWIEEVEFHASELLASHDDVFVIGLSMGAMLALYVASLFPVRGVVVMSPAILVGGWANRLKVTLVAPFKPILPKSEHYHRRNPGQQPYYGYPAFPLRTVKQVFRLVRFVQPILSKVEAPALVMHTHADITTPMANAHYVMDHISSVEKQLKEYAISGHVLPDGEEKEQVWADISEFLNPLGTV